MTLGTLLFIALLLMMLGAMPTWPRSRSWGYAPSGVMVLMALVLFVLLLLGRI